MLSVNKILMVYSCMFTVMAFSQRLTKQDSLKLVVDSLSATKLKEVVINSNKPLLESKSDRFIFNVANTSLVIGNNVWNILRETPLLTAEEDGTLKIMRMQNATVYINGRKSIMAGKDLYEYLKNMPADNVVKIEIITSPSAKYDGSDGGIINLVLKKMDNDGLKGSIAVTDEQKRKNSQNTNLFLNYHKNKYSQSFTFHLGQNRSLLKNTDDNFLYADNSTQYISSKTNSKDFHVGGTTAVDYEVNSNNIIGGVFELHTNTPVNEQFNDNITKLQDGSYTNHYNAINANDGSAKMVAGNLFYRYHTDPANRSLEFNFDWAYRENDNANQFHSYAVVTPEIWETAYLIGTDEIRRNFTLKLDYSQAIGKKGYFLEAGAKSNFLNLSSPYEFSDWSGFQWVVNLSNTNHFRYRENISAAYLTLSRKFFEKMDIKLGLRYEKTAIRTEQEATQVQNNRDYNNWIPSANINYRFNDNHNLSFSFRRSLWRPYANELNPFIFYTNDNYATSGNPDLANSDWKTFKLTYNLKKTYTFLFTYQTISNNISNNVFDEGGIYVTRPVNLLSQMEIYSLGFNFYKSFFKDRVNCNLNTGWNYNNNDKIARANDLDLKSNGNLQLSLSLSYSNLFKTGINANGWMAFYTPSDFGNFTVNKAPLLSNFSLSKYWEKPSLDFRLTVNDPFNIYDWDYTNNSPVGKFHSAQRPDFRGISISVSKRFGNDKAKDTRKQESSKDRIESGKNTK